MNSFDLPTRPPQGTHVCVRVIVLALVGGALACAGVVTGQSLYRSSQRKQVLALYAPYLSEGEGVLKADGSPCRVLVIESPYQGWPGSNPEYLVVTDLNYHVKQVLPSRPESMFMDHSFDPQDSPQTLTIRRAVRPGLQVEIIKYAFVGTELREISRLLDPPEVRIPPDFKLRKPVKGSD